MNHLGPEECPLCWRFDCRCWEACAAQGMSPEGPRREGGSGASAPTSPVPNGDAPKGDSQ